MLARRTHDPGLRAYAFAGLLVFAAGVVYAVEPLLGFVVMVGMAVALHYAGWRRSVLVFAGAGGAGIGDVRTNYPAGLPPAWIHAGPTDPQRVMWRTGWVRKILTWPLALFVLVLTYIRQALAMVLHASTKLAYHVNVRRRGGVTFGFNYVGWPSRFA